MSHFQPDPIGLNRSGFPPASGARTGRRTCHLAGVAGYKLSMPLKVGFEALGPVACPMGRFEGQHRIAIGVIDIDNTFCSDNSDLEPVDSTRPYCMALDLHATYY